jgi:SPP1 family predicted phage head-tail adaptor
MRHKITIEKQGGTTNDGGGNFVQSWVTVATVWASFTEYRGSQQAIVAGKPRADTSHIITIRYNPNVAENMRIWLKDRLFIINFMFNIKQLNKEMQLYVTETENNELQY